MADHPPSESLEVLFDVLDRVPFVSGLKRDLRMLRRMVYERRAPRLAVVGHSGSGRSTLLNALMVGRALPTDAHTPEGWIRLDTDGARIDWLEIDAQQDETAGVASFRRATNAMTPDVLFVVATPREVEEGLGLVLDRTHALLQTLDKDVRPKLIPVLTHSDEIPDSAKLDLLRQRFDRQLADEALDRRRIFVVGRGPGDLTAGVDALSEAVIGELPEVAKVEGCRAMPRATAARRDVANDVVRSCSTLSVTVALAPVPLSDIVFIAPLQILMVTSLAYLAGRRWDTRTASEWIASVGVVGGAGFGLRWGARQLVKLVPGAGSVISAGIAGAGTVGLGRTAVTYFLGPTSVPPELLDGEPASD